MGEYVVGLDLGQAKDFTAAAVLQRPRFDPKSKQPPIYMLRHLARYPLGTPYTTIVPSVSLLLRTPPVRGAPLVVDYTGVGRPLVDMLKKVSGISRVVPVTVTGGHAVTQGDDGSFHVPKKELVTCSQIVFQARRLQIARSLPLTDVLVEELQNFKVKITPATNEVFGDWREGAHDDLVFAVVLAIWWAERNPRTMPQLPIVVGGTNLDALHAGV